MLAIVLAVLLGAPQGGTVYTADGGRLRGTVLDAGTGGVTVQLADGSTRKLESSQVSRVEFADGTSWKPAAPAAAAAPQGAPAQPATRAPPPAPATQAAATAPGSAGAAAPAVTAAAVAVPLAVAATTKPSPLQIPVEKLDTVYLARGGRVRCLVTEEGPEGVVVRLVDGAERRYPPGQVGRIDWADGTRSDLAIPPPAPATPAAAPAR